ncbi:MAG: ABC transporter ATP-binding protein [Sedimentibacter sp.]|uniref:ABC transporter ATP-binding protein n=1 Tax=Sedimentibacter sp. TaxID=1960295 RepID=UPI002981E64F|nr:ABC transporter ATP-binding protein [Sedimentibacter sp.]MDW5299985.1 ABC transporter ATP-binding protein [Sedimentibacter sp.]
MIRLKNVSKKYDELEILKDFNISIEENKITCLFGCSGVGKTTIANIIAGLIPIDKGEITGTEHAVFSYVFQEPRLLEWYNVYDNIDFVLKDIYDNDKRKKIVSSYIEMVELTDYKLFMPRALSGGMAQRVSLARAFAYPSNILIMDEPFKGLDVKLKKDMIALFLMLWNVSKRTVLFITHDVDEAVTLSNTIHIIKNKHAILAQTIDVDNTDNKDSIKTILLS